MKYWVLLCLGCLVSQWTTANEQPADQDWPVYLGDKSSSQYSSLQDINLHNLARLEVAWQYRTGDLWHPSQSQIQTNPLVIDGVLYGLSPRINAFALNAQTGELLWRFDPEAAGVAISDKGEARSLGNARGLAYWSSGKDKRLFVALGHRLLAINATNGQLVKSFGEQGFIDLREHLGRDKRDLFVGATSPGVVYGDLLIQGTRVGEGSGAAPGYVRAYNTRSGALAWTFHTIPKPGEYGYDSWPADAYKSAGGANSWAGMSLDEQRGIVYIPTGSAAFDFWGGNRQGKNLFANSLVALNAADGKQLWHFQTVHHDIWDRDLPAPPNLVTVKKNGKNIDAVAQVTKSGMVFVFDRVSGEPLFPIEEKPVPASTLEGEKAWPTQPFPVLPEPFTRQSLNASDIRDVLDPEGKPIKQRVANYKLGGQFVPFDTQGVVMFPGFDGGAEWGGAATSPDGILYVNANEMPWVASLEPVKQTRETTNINGEQLYLENCSVCHGAALEGDERSPSLLGLNKRLNADQVAKLIKVGQGFMPAFAHLGDEQLQALLGYLWQGDVLNWQPEVAQAKESIHYDLEQVPYRFNGYHRLVDSDGNPATTPPWGTLSAIDLNTGQYAWQIPLGDMSETSATDNNVKPTGAENYGGPLVTAGDLLVIAATRDEKLRIFNRVTGELLWQYALPAGGYATPATYRYAGRQYIVVAVGGGKMGTPSYDAYIAFALKEPD